MKQKDFKELLEKAGMKFQGSMEINKEADALAKGGEAHLEKVRELAFKHELGRHLSKHMIDNGIVDLRKYREEVVPYTGGKIIRRTHEDVVFVFTKEQTLEILKSLPKE